MAVPVCDLLEEWIFGDWVDKTEAEGVGLILLSGATLLVFCGLIKFTDIFLVCPGVAPNDFFIGDALNDFSFGFTLRLNGYLAFFSAIAAFLDFFTYGAMESLFWLACSKTASEAADAPWFWLVLLVDSCWTEPFLDKDPFLDLGLSYESYLSLSIGTYFFFKIEFKFLFSLVILSALFFLSFPDEPSFPSAAELSFSILNLNLIRLNLWK